MSQYHRPSLMKRTNHSFQTLAPAALADWLIDTHGFAALIPMANESYRLTTGGMVIAIFTYGLVLCEGRQPDAAALLLGDVCDADGGVE